MPHTTLSAEGARALGRLQLLAERREHDVLSHDRFLAAALPEIAAGLGCGRVSLWTYLPRDGGQRLRCEALHDRRGVAIELARLAEADHPAYFAELDRSGILCAADIQAHPALATLRETYLRPNDIRSLLDVPFAANGRRIGLLCGEQPGASIVWAPCQIAFMRRAGVVGSRLFHRLGCADAGSHGELRPWAPLRGHTRSGEPASGPADLDSAPGALDVTLPRRRVNDPAPSSPR
ncbi:MAG TPA: GAF domain-containing protein [Methylibium sp.]|nr:GAF domain-containing protein [Methylibium sp.]